MDLELTRTLTFGQTCGIFSIERIAIGNWQLPSILGVGSQYSKDLSRSSGYPTALRWNIDLQRHEAKQTGRDCIVDASDKPKLSFRDAKETVKD